MGLAASQARLLTLQSRMNDLELQCMRCSNDKIVMSMLSNNVSIKYNKMLEEAENVGPTIITTNSVTKGNQSSNSTTSNPGWNFSPEFNYSNLKTLGYDIAPTNSQVVKNVTGGATTKSWVWDKTSEEVVVTPARYEQVWVQDATSSNSTTSTSSAGSSSQSNSGWEMPKTIEDVVKLLGNQGGKGLFDTANYGATAYNNNEELVDMRVKPTKNFKIGNTEFTTSGYYSISEVAKLLGSVNGSQVSLDKTKLESVMGSKASTGSSSTASSSGHYEYVYVPAETKTIPVDDSKKGNENYGHWEYSTTPEEVSYSYAENDLVKECKSNASKLKESLINGTVSLYQNGQPVSLSDVASYKESTSQTSTANSDWSETTTSENLSYTERDKKRQAAETWFSKEMGMISQQEKMLDLKAKNAETQYQAACTEFESVKSLVSKNVERGFTIFS